MGAVSERSNIVVDGGSQGCSSVGHIYGRPYAIIMMAMTENPGGCALQSGQAVPQIANLGTPRG